MAFNKVVVALLSALIFVTFTAKQSPAANRSCESILSATPPGELTPRSTLSDILTAAKGEAAGRFTGPAAYMKIYEFLSDPLVVKKLRLPNAARDSNAAKSRVRVEKFAALSDQQLQAQWEGPQLTMPFSDTATYWGEIRNLKRGDFVQVSRRVSMSREDLAEFLQIGFVTSRLHYALNFDSQKVASLFNKIGFKLRDRLQYNIGFGGLGISTSYRSDGWGKMPDNMHLVSGSQAKALGKEDFVVLLTFAVPVEAIVLLDSNYTIPEHVLTNARGYGFVQPHAAEGEITFIDSIPIEWMTNLGELRESFAKATSVGD